MKMDEKCESAQNTILKLTAFQDALLLANGILNYELTLTIKNIDVTQETLSHLRGDKNNSGKHYSKNMKGENWFYPECN